MTQNVTDLAIDGGGFFELENELGEKVYSIGAITEIGSGKPVEVR